MHATVLDPCIYNYYTSTTQAKHTCKTMNHVVKNKTSSLSSSSVSVMNKAAAAAVNDNDTAQPQPQPQAKKNLWRPEEDLILKTYIETHGEGNWGTVSYRSGLNRSGKSCRLRWKNYLRPNIKRGHMSQDEQDLILRMHNLLGNRWSLIAGRLPGRTDNEIKNYWNTHLNKINTTTPSSPTSRTPKRKTPYAPPPSTSTFNAISHDTKKKNKIMEDPNSATIAHPLVTAAAATTNQIQNQKHNVSPTSTTSHHLHHQEQEDSSSPKNYAMITTPTTASTYDDEACFYYDHIQSPSRVSQHCHYYMQPTNHQSNNNAALAATAAAGFVFDDDPLIPTYDDLESFLLL